MIDVSAFTISHRKVVTKTICRAAFKTQKLLSWSVLSLPPMDFISTPLSRTELCYENSFLHPPFRVVLRRSNDFRLLSKISNKDLPLKIKAPLPKKCPITVYCIRVWRAGFFSITQHPTINDITLDMEFIIGKENQIVSVRQLTCLISNYLSVSLLQELTINMSLLMCYVPTIREFLALAIGLPLISFVWHLFISVSLSTSWQKNTTRTRS